MESLGLETLGIINQMCFYVVLSNQCLILHLEERNSNWDWDCWKIELLFMGNAIGKNTFYTWIQRNTLNGKALQWKSVDGLVFNRSVFEKPISSGNTT